MVAYINNQFIEEENAALGIADLSIQRGYAIFDYFRARNYVPLFLDDYLDRFYRSANGLRLLPLPSREELKDIITEMIRRNKVPDAGFKIILTGGYSPDGFETADSNLVILQQPVSLPGKEDFEKGMKIILHEYLRDFPAVKTTSYLMAVFLRPKIIEQQADEVLYHKSGQVSEFPRSNVFIVTKDNTVITPAENVLHGITRKKVLELASKKYKTVERPVTVEEMQNAAEVFLTSTTKRVFPVLSIDGKPVGNGQPGTITTDLYHSFLHLEDNFLHSFKRLSTSVM